MTAVGSLGSDAPDRYPVLLDLAGRAALVVGGGPVAARRAAGLRAAGAQVTVIAPGICEDLMDLVAEGAVVWLPREATADDVTAGPEVTGANRPTEHAEAAPATRPADRARPAGAAEPTEPAAASERAEAARAARPAERADPADRAELEEPVAGHRWWLVHTATGDPLVDEAIAQRAHIEGIWWVRADRAEHSAARIPALAHGPDGVQVAVSGGGDPGRARAIRDAISDLLATGALPLRRTRTPAARRSRRVRADRVGANPTRSAPTPSRPDAIPGRVIGRVVLVGGGPGDPGLITVSGRQWLARADVVVTDRLGPTSLLSELAADVEIIDVGKTAGNHPIPQHEINRILVEHAQAGSTVVRLKGGDPFVLGRGGEEALHCLAHGIPVEVVPGVTSAVSVPAAAGIPVTHRGITTSLVIASAHAGAGQALDAARTAPRDATLVLLMGLSGLAATAGELIASGRDPGTPVAVISDGWTPRQRTVTGTLSSIAAEVSAARLPGPAVIVVGDVVGLRAELGDLSGVPPVEIAQAG
jgi:uroporphyrin-III C-methyltransferase/precorrin-2 dehydrogenase/sirohydrochlorin ferrochelatase